MDVVGGIVAAGDVARCGRAASRRARGPNCPAMLPTRWLLEKRPNEDLPADMGLLKVNDAADPAHGREPGDGSAGPGRWARLLSGAGSNDADAPRMNPAVITYMPYKSIAELSST